MMRAVRLSMVVCLLGLSVTPARAGEDPPTLPENVLCDPGFEGTLNDTCWQSTNFPGAGTNHAVIDDEEVRSGVKAATLCPVGSPAGCVGAIGQLVHVPDNLQQAIGRIYTNGTTTDSSVDCTTEIGFYVQHPTSHDLATNGLNCEDVMNGTYVELLADYTSVIVPYSGKDVWLWVVGESEAAGTLYADDAHFGFVGEDDSERTVTLQLRKHLKAKGLVSMPAGGPAACMEGTVVKIQRRVGGEWRTVEIAETDEVGLYSVPIPDKESRFRVVAPRDPLGDGTGCGRAVSATKTHSH